MRTLQRLRVSVVIATWNAADVLGRCLDSVLEQDVRGGHETIVVDNASSDDTVELLRAYADRVRVIVSDRNLHFSGGNNLAASEANGSVLFLLNPDTELLSEDVLDRLAAVAERPDVGIAGPRLRNPDGSLQRSCAGFPTVLRAVVIGVGLHHLLPDRLRARVAPEFWSHDRPLATDWLMGAAVAIRAEVFREVGGFWPTLYGEEEDLAYRIRRRGLQVRFEPDVEVMHVGNHSIAQQLDDRGRAAAVAEAELNFVERHYSRPRALAIRVLIGAGYAGRAAVLSLIGRRQRAATYRTMTAIYARRSTAARG